MKTAKYIPIASIKDKKRAGILKGALSAKGLKIGIVVAEFNELLTDRLLDGALDELGRLGARDKDITVVSVPGAFEIPLAAQQLIRKIKPNAVLTLAVVIKGKTKHFDQVVQETAKGVRELSQKTSVPVILGMIPASEVTQAILRVGIKHTNKGREWAQSAVKMANLMKKI